MSKERFSKKAENYSKFRPSYPKEIIELLQMECGLNLQSVVADIGAGTGIFTNLIAGFCRQVFAVEPNDEMADKILQRENLTVVNATAENTTLNDGSVDIITAAQSFHWFDKAPAKKEFTRILKAGGYVVLIWNTRNRISPLEKAYEEICDNYRDGYLKENDKRNSDKDKFDFFEKETGKKFVFENSRQELSFEQMQGRLLSLSYMPLEHEDEFTKISEKLKTLFNLHSENGKVTLTMNTEVYIGKV